MRINTQNIVNIYTSCVASKHSHWLEFFSVWLCLELIGRNYSACGSATDSVASTAIPIVIFHHRHFPCVIDTCHFVSIRRGGGDSC